MHFGWLSVRRPPPERVNVLARLAREPQLRICDIVDLIGIAERDAGQIVNRSTPRRSSVTRSVAPAD